MAISTKSLLSAADIVTILEASRKNGVSKLKFDTLEVFFDASLHDGPSGAQTVKSEQSAEQIAHTQNEEEKKAIEADEFSVREDQIAELLISDPLLAEELMLQGDLTESEETVEDESS